MKAIDIALFVASFRRPAFARWYELEPWQLTMKSDHVVRELLSELPSSEFVITEEVAVHRSAKVEVGSVLKGPLVLGAGCFVAAGAYIRGGCWLAENCTPGPGAELKSSFVFAGSKLAHFNFVGDSLLGENVNLEAGSIICNYRNERADKEVFVRLGAKSHATSVEKFGALVGDGSRIGANAVVAPGALIAPNAVIARGALVDQEASGQSGN
jgi:bifunctional UDP-N-acetylglucosamine pyrophosphorylase / glucosamine-1-phosphate N-acetyltransferase